MLVFLVQKFKRKNIKDSNSFLFAQKSKPEKLMCPSDSQVTLLLSCCCSLLKIHGYMIVVTWDRPITHIHSKKCCIKEASSEFSASCANIFKILLSRQQITEHTFLTKCIAKNVS